VAQELSTAAPCTNTAALLPFFIGDLLRLGDLLGDVALFEVGLRMGESDLVPTTPIFVGEDA